MGQSGGQKPGFPIPAHRSASSSGASLDLSLLFESRREGAFPALREAAGQELLLWSALSARWVWELSSPQLRKLRVRKL